MLGLLSKNNSVVIAAIILLLIRWSMLAPYVLPWMKENGLNLGIIVITVAVLVPIATGDVRLQDLYNVINSHKGWVVIIAGILVAILGAAGLGLLADDPEVTVGLILGTILGIVLFKGVPVGPLIGAGIAVVLLKGLDLLKFW
ncbi:hypothetical protein BHF68_12080 [Desulfuribacillus alkaliarsenatis]|uniref:UPF0756 membrane protein BHF68_12080 n=2 Tax=Desulfuribacillus alkaliarsenatis TaxID=766136 RepID=A0A1E5FZK0_9FIRM|nr:hypothetical protein BHF68_12080 [Desulfuribacillus alkaliarsenatis]